MTRCRRRLLQPATRGAPSCLDALLRAVHAIASAPVAAAAMALALLCTQTQLPANWTAAQSPAPRTLPGSPQPVAAWYSAADTASTLTAIDLSTMDPLTVTATRTKLEPCIVSWTPAANAPDGLRYDVLDQSGTTLASGVGGSSTTIDVSAMLTPRVRARMSNMYSSASTTSGTTCPWRPDAPRSLVLTAGYKQLVASWTAPVSNGGAPITSYTALTSAGQSCTTATTSCAIPGLTAGTTYTVSVTATNSAGTSVPSATNVVTPYAEPYPVNNLLAVPNSMTSGAVNVTWSAPQSSGTPVSTFTTTMTHPKDSTSRTCNTGPPSYVCNFTGLINGLTYTVTVTGTNAHGTSAPVTTTVMPYPTALMTTAQMRLWLDAADATTLTTDVGCAAPVSAAGQSVACWKDKSGQGNDLTSTTADERPTATASGTRLVPVFDGTNDILRRATSTLPTGATTMSTVLNATFTGANPLTTAQKNLFYQGTSGGSGAAKARFVVKANGSDQAATNANMTASAVSGPIVSNQSFITASQWFAGASYAMRFSGRPRVSQAVTYSVTDSNVEIGAASTTSWLGPITEVIALNVDLSDANARILEEYLARKWDTMITPKAPTVLNAKQGDSATATAEFTWPAPAWDGGSPVTSYTITSNTGGFTCTVAAPALNCSISGLTKTTSYVFTLVATNALGASAGVGKTVVWNNLSN